MYLEIPKAAEPPSCQPVLLLRLFVSTETEALPLGIYLPSVYATEATFPVEELKAPFERIVPDPKDC